MIRLKSEQRYQDDPVFAAIVDTLYSMLSKSENSWTPTELREAAMLAALKYEYTHVRPMFVQQLDSGIETMIEDLLAKIRTLQRSGHACSDAPCTICEVIRAFNRVLKSERKQALLGTCTSKYGDCAHFEDPDCKNWKPKARF